MSDYRVKEGLNQALVDLVAIDPQPRSAGVQATRRTYAADGTVHDEGLFVELVYDVLEDATALDDLLDQFGLDAATTANVTIYAPNQLHVYTRYNGLAVRPETRRNNYFLRDVTIVVRDLAAL